MFKFLKRKPKPKTKTRIPLVKIYTDKFGNDWFQYENPLTIPAKRAISAEVATRYAEMKLTRDELKLLINHMKELGNKGNFVDVFAIINEIEFRVESLAEENTLLELAMCYFLLDGEDETDIDKSANQRKMEIWSTDDDARGFFLEKSFQSTIQFSNMLESDIPDYLGKILKEQNREGQKLSHILHQLKRGNTLMK
jgi:hypothetical protein